MDKQLGVQATVTKGLAKNICLRLQLWTAVQVLNSSPIRFELLVQSLVILQNCVICPYLSIPSSYRLKYSGNFIKVPQRSTGFLFLRINLKCVL